MWHDAAHRLDARGERVGETRLKTDRAGLGHPIGNGDLPHVHVRHHRLHDFDRTGRPGHDSPSQRAKIKGAELLMTKDRDEHGGHTVEVGAALFLDGTQNLERIERLAWVHHGGGVGQTGEISHHHAKAVIQRDWEADTVRRADAGSLPDLQPVIQQVVVREGDSLGKAGGTAGELNVAWIVALDRYRSYRVGTCELTARNEVAVGEVAVVLELIQHNDMAQVGETLAADGHLTARPFRYERGDHVEVVAGFEMRRSDKRFAGRGSKHVLEFENPVGWINVDQDQTGLCGGELDYSPLRAVGGPDPQPIPGS